MTGTLHNPWFWILVVWYVFSAFVDGMPKPDEKSGKGYEWAYASLHSLAGRFKTVLQATRNGNGNGLKGPVDPQT
jgi:hypothetical protein